MAATIRPTDVDTRGRHADVPVDDPAHEQPAVLQLEADPPHLRGSRDGLRTVLGWVVVAAGIAAAVLLTLAAALGDDDTTTVVDAAAVSGSDQRLHNLSAEAAAVAVAEQHLHPHPDPVAVGPDQAGGVPGRGSDQRLHNLAGDGPP